MAAAISALSLAAAGATPASAASALGVTYSGSSLCVTVSTEVMPYSSQYSDDNGFVYADAEPYFSNCSTPQEEPYGDVATQAEVYKWTGSSWAYCASTGWVYEGYRVEDGFPSFGAYAAGYLAGTCGAGYYGVQGAGFVWANPTGGGYQWNGNWVWSGYEYYPVTITPARVAMTPSKQSQATAPLGGAGGARFDKLPTETPVVNHAGQLIGDTHGNLETHRTDVQPPVQSAR
ncbi:MAG: hypothetical protein ABSG43_12900 [Solirubrobacteraceae bacterium]